MHPTIADLLDTLKIKDGLDVEDSILNIPISLFTEDQQEELISIIWLIGKKWFDCSKPQNQDMGQISARQVSEFFNNIKKQIKAIIVQSKQNGGIASPQVVKAIGTWINSTLVTQFTRKNAVFNLMEICSKCSYELNFLLSWVNGYAPTKEKQKKLVQLLSKKITPQSYKESVDRVANVFAQFNSFNNTRDPKSYITLKLKTQLTAADKENFHPDIIDFYSKIYDQLCKQYTLTPGAWLNMLGITVPENLRLDLVQLLQQDLHQVPGLTAEQLPDLLYYTSQFIFGQATADLQLMNFTYSSQEDTASLQFAAQHFQFFLAAHAHYVPAGEKSYSQALKAELLDCNIGRDSRIIALCCFENCPLLRKMFTAIWQKQGLTVHVGKTIALKPSDNPFFLGYLLTREGTKSYILNSAGLVDFICNNTSNISEEPNYEDLVDFFKAMPDQNGLNIVFNEVIISKKLINLDDIGHLNIQLKNVDSKLEELRRKLAPLAEPRNTQETLIKRWLKAQIHMHELFANLLKDKLDEQDKAELAFVLSARERSDESIDKMLSSKLGRS